MPSSEPLSQPCLPASLKHQHAYPQASRSHSSYNTRSTSSLHARLPLGSFRTLVTEFFTGTTAMIVGLLAGSFCRWRPAHVQRRRRVRLHTLECEAATGKMQEELQELQGKCLPAGSMKGRGDEREVAAI